MIQSIERAIAILEAMADAGGSARLQQLAQPLGLKTSTAHNILKTLNKMGYVQRREGSTLYYLGERILTLTRVIGDDDALRSRLRPCLNAIAEKTRETVFVAVPCGKEVYFLDAIESDRPLKAASPLGQRSPMAGSAIGMIFLAFIPRLREALTSLHAEQRPAPMEAEIQQIYQQGYALDLEVFSADLNCVAIPWLDNGEVRAGIGISGPASRLPEARLRELASIMATVLHQ